MCQLENLKSQYPHIPDELWHMLYKLDVSTYNHSLRVCDICKLVETELNFKDKTLSQAGLLHDVGKYYISQNILDKKGTLTSAERRFIDAHAFLSYDTLKQFNIADNICDIVLYHHSLKPVLFDYDIKSCDNTMIKELAIILKTIDVFEAITSDRPYHRGVTTDAAIKHIESMTHNQKVLLLLKQNF